MKLLDVWLPRINHFSQLGLFAIAMWSLYFTVLPLYQKAVLEESIAKKELELAASEKALEQTYSRIRHYAVREFVFSAGAECSSLMIRPSDTRWDAKPSPAPSMAEQILKIDTEACLKKELQQVPSLKELRPKNLRTLSDHVIRIATEIKKRQGNAWEKYKSLPQNAAKDPSILKPPGHFGEGALILLSKLHYPPSEIEATRFSLSIQETQSAVAYEYDNYVRDQILTLRSIDWNASK